MRGRVVFASTLVAVVGMGGVVATAAHATQDGHARSSVEQTNQAATKITVVERAVTDTLVDLGPKGDSLGDQSVFANPIYNRTNSTKVGRDQGSCVRTVVGKAWQCSLTTWLPKGSLVVEGPFYDKRDSVFAITGGTGSYSRSRGVMHLHARNAKGTAFTFAFTVQN